MKIKVDDVLPVFVPNVFAPESSLGNHAFKVLGDERVHQVKKFRVFDRTGALVLEQENKKLDDADFGWNGTWKGRLVNPGVFAFFAEVEYCDGRVKFLEGSVTLVR